MGRHATVAAALGISIDARTAMQIRLSVAAAIALLLGALAGAEAAATITVAQHGLVFTKASVALSRGDRIVFTNEDDVIHNIHIFGPGDEQKDLGVQKPGATLAYVFDKPGSYMVRCNIHPSVRLAVTAK
jgi:plastocyanin